MVECIMREKAEKRFDVIRWANNDDLRGENKGISKCE